MPDQIINKASALGGAISVWFKVIGTVMVLIGYGFLTYYQIQGNSQGINELKILLRDNNEIVKREFEIWGTRSDKRYARASKTAEDLQDVDKAHEKEMKELKEKHNEDILELTKEIWYIKGVLSTKK